MRRRSRLSLLLLGTIGLLLVSAAPGIAGTYTLRPDVDILTGWTETPAGPGWDRLNDVVLQPTAPTSGTDYIWRGGAPVVSAVGVSTQNLAPGEAPILARAWFYADRLAKVDLMWGGVVRATKTLTSGTAEWHTIAAAIPDQAAVDDISLRFTKTTPLGLEAKVFAAYVELTTVDPPDLPTPPQSYTVPGGAVSVDTSAELTTELTSSTPHDIVLENGTYDTSGSFAFATSTAHRLWARTLGEATLNAGLVFGGPSGSGGGEVHGLEFEVTDPAKAVVQPGQSSGMLITWGPAGRHTKVYDTTFQGDPGTDHQIDAGIFNTTPEGAVIERVVVRDVKRWGVFVQRPDEDHMDPDDQYNYPDEAQTVRDIDVERVAMPTPGESNGTSEAGLWIGAPVANAVERLRLEHAAWEGLWTGGSSKDTIFRDITVSSADKPGGGFGIYPELYGLGNTYEQFAIGPNIRTGINCEWHHDTAYVGCDNARIQDGLIDSSSAGVSLDNGSRDNLVQRVVFRSQNCAGINDFLGINNTYVNNNFFGLDPGTPEIRTGANMNTCPPP